MKYDIKNLKIRLGTLEMNDKATPDENDYFQPVKTTKEKGIIIHDDDEDGASFDHPNEGIFSIEKLIYQKWYIRISLVTGNEYVLDTIALVDSGADMNCIKEGLIPFKYFEKNYSES